MVNRRKSASTFKISLDCLRLAALSMYDSKPELEFSQELGNEVHRQIQEDDIKPAISQKSIREKTVPVKEQILICSKVRKKATKTAKEIVQKSNVREVIDKYKLQFESYEVDLPIDFRNFYGTPDYLFKTAKRIHIVDLKTTYTESSKPKDVIQVQVYMYILAKSHPKHKISGELLYVQQKKNFQRITALDVALGLKEMCELENTDRIIDNILDNLSNTHYQRKKHVFCLERKCSKIADCFSDSALLDKLKSGKKISLQY